MSLNTLDGDLQERRHNRHAAVHRWSSVRRHRHSGSRRILGRTPQHHVRQRGGAQRNCETAPAEPLAPSRSRPSIRPGALSSCQWPIPPRASASPSTARPRRRSRSRAATSKSPRQAQDVSLATEFPGLGRRFHQHAWHSFSTSPRQYLVRGNRARCVGGAARRRHPQILVDKMPNITSSGSMTISSTTSAETIANAIAASKSGTVLPGGLQAAVAYGQATSTVTATVSG